MIGESLDLALAAQAAELSRLRGQLAPWLVGVGASEEEAEAIALACSEACANAIVHGGGAAPITLSANRQDGGVAITVHDAGSWREPRRRGYGLELMRALMDGVEVLTADDGTTVRMTKSLA